MNTYFQESLPFWFSRLWGKIKKEGRETSTQMALLTKLKHVGYKTPTRKKATCRWLLSEASCAGVRPVLSVTIRSSFLPACTNTVQASKLPLIAAQWRGVQPKQIQENISQNNAFKIKNNSSLISAHEQWIISTQWKELRVEDIPSLSCRPLCASRNKRRRILSAKPL